MGRGTSEGHGSQYEVAPIGQMWDTLSIKTNNDSTELYKLLENMEVNNPQTLRPSTCIGTYTRTYRRNRERQGRSFSAAHQLINVEDN